MGYLKASDECHDMYYKHLALFVSKKLNNFKCHNEKIIVQRRHKSDSGNKRPKENLH